MQVKEFLESLEQMGGTCIDVGTSTLGEKIPLFHKGNSLPGGVLLVGGTHAREYVTSYLLRDLFKEYVGDYPVDVIPMLNPDGVRLSLEGLNGLALTLRDRTLLSRINNHSLDFSLWKANARGVDLNVNCDARWGQGKSNICYPSPENYVGPHPFSEMETLFIKKVLEKGNYALVVCYHSKGEEVYYGFDKNVKYQGEAKLVANRLGYALKRTPHSTGGIKDYFTLTTGRLGLTIEVGSDTLTHPIGLEYLNIIKQKHKGIITLYAEIAKRLWTKYNTCTSPSKRHKKPKK